MMNHDDHNTRFCLKSEMETTGDFFTHVNIGTWRWKELLSAIRRTTITASVCGECVVRNHHDFVLN